MARVPSALLIQRLTRILWVSRGESASCVWVSVAKKLGQARAAVFVWSESLWQRPEKQLERMLVNHSLDTTAGNV